VWQLNVKWTIRDFAVGDNKALKELQNQKFSRYI
jgi:hypothetical protein